jgi:DNA-binding MarR family transcriptional regulator
VETLLRSEDCNCFAVRSALGTLDSFYDQFLAPIGLRTTQFSILAKLKRRGPLTIHALAKGMVIHRTTLRRNILPLERNGLIRIQLAASDRRAKELQLTKAGESASRRRSWARPRRRHDSSRRSVKYESICTYLEATQRLSSGGWRSLTVKACADR